MADVKPIPDDYPQVIPYLSVEGASAAIDFYTRVFGATERMRLPGPGGSVGHAELEIGKSMIMLADVSAETAGRSPQSLGGTPITVMIYVDDVDAVYQAAVDAGATADRPVEDQFYGDRAGQLIDPFGHKWFVASHTEDLSPEEMQKRMPAMAG